MPELATTELALSEAIAVARQKHSKVAFVPTMGALHDGHLKLVEVAKNHAEFVVVSIFVNPTQFGENEDFTRYPRTLDADLEKLDGIADLVFAPSVETIYPNGQAITQHAGPVGNTFEGEARPGHFDGMLTVVARLFELVEPDFAVFGEKDAQQLFLVNKLIEGKFPNIQLVPVETQREPSGLAMSSRNRFLNAEQTDIAEILAITLASVDHLIRDGKNPIDALEIGREIIQGEPETKLEYLELVDLDTFTPVKSNHSGDALLIVAAIVGSVRLIDNHHIKL